MKPSDNAACCDWPRTTATIQAAIVSATIATVAVRGMRDRVARLSSVSLR
jgi:hypothetical protein